MLEKRGRDNYYWPLSLSAQTVLIKKLEISLENDKKARPTCNLRKKNLENSFPLQV